MGKRIMREFKLNEISSVTTPAQKGARALIIKSADHKTSKRDLSRIRNAMREADFNFEQNMLSKFAERIAADALGENPIEAELFNVAESAETSEQLNKCYAALCVSVNSIFGDADALNKGDLLQSTLQQFKDALQGVVAESAEETISQALDGAAHGGEMSKIKEIAKALGLAETATEEDILAGVIKVAKTEKDELVAKLAKAEALNKLTAKHKAFMESGKKMPAGGQDAFVAMSDAQRNDHMASCGGDEPDDTAKLLKSGDAFKTLAGKIILKSKVGEDVFETLKSQDEEIRKSRERADKAEAEQRESGFAKKAEAFSKVGKSDELGKLLAKTASFDLALADAWSVVLSTAEERIAKGDLFSEKGSGVRGFGKALDAINAKAQELLAKRETGFNTIEKCRVEMRKRFPDLANQEAEEAKEAKRAA